MTISIDPSSIDQHPMQYTLCRTGHGYHGIDVEYCWDCPTCERHTMAYRAEQATRFEIAEDARCVYCRNKERV